jgi:hypothetical protein
LEFLQAQVERRRGGERGVRWVRGLRGDGLWKSVDETIPREALEAAIAAIPHEPRGEPRRDPDATLFQFEYVDGLLGHVLMLPSFARGTSVALKLKGTDRVLATRFDERTEPRYPHFAYLLKAIERMIHKGEPSYPVERTVLTSGILDRALTSLAEGQRRIETPELSIRYNTADYPNAPRPSLTVDPRF